MPPSETARFFDRYARSFEAVAGLRPGPVERLVNRLARRSLRLRFERTITGCQPLAGQSVLDVGCGPGLYALALATGGAARVLGIDFAPAMVEQARANARRAGVEERCRFEVADFATYAARETFDYGVVMGVMDYVAAPRAIIDKTISLVRRRAFFSFPERRGLLAWQRRLRYRRRCPLYLYDRGQVAGLFRDLPVRTVSVEKLHRDYFVTVER